MEEKIMYKYENRIGIHNTHNKSGKKVPPLVIL